MVDFNKLLSPQDRGDLAVYKGAVAECMLRTDDEMVGHAIHIMHNASAPRDYTGAERHATNRDYSAALHFIVLPDLIRRLAGGVPPQKCPVCGTWIDWNVMLMGAQPSDTAPPIEAEHVSPCCPDCKNDCCHWANTGDGCGEDC